MRRHHFYTFEYESDELGERFGSIRVIPVLVEIEFDLEINPMYDSPYGPLGNGATVENVIVTDVCTEHGITVKDFYDEGGAFMYEVDRAILMEHRNMIEQTTEMVGQ